MRLCDSQPIILRKGGGRTWTYRGGIGRWVCEGDGEVCVYESSGNSNEPQTYLYDFPDPISKVGIQTEERTDDTNLSVRL
jgi:hypothetical protein